MARKSDPGPVQATAQTQEIQSVPSIHVRFRGLDGIQLYQRLAVEAIRQGKKAPTFAEEILSQFAKNLPKV